MIFDGFPGGPGAEGVGCSLVPIPTAKQSGGALQQAKYIIEPAGIKKYVRKNQDANYENTENEGCNMLSLQQRKQDTG